MSKRDGASNIWHQSLDGSLPVQITNFTEDLIYYYDWSNDDHVVSRGTKAERYRSEPKLLVGQS
ncbi:MAG TPA: hypothetical protein VLB68_06615 [Pyrinomonadaceae bacterium]|nr:hypothetical protein [Pyrinomonadaceae bacterium]